jgi:hypothetical protein
MYYRPQPSNPILQLNHLPHHHQLGQLINLSSQYLFLSGYDLTNLQQAFQTENKLPLSPLLFVTRTLFFSPLAEKTLWHPNPSAVAAKCQD